MTEVTVVMPAYNSEHFIGRAIESVLAQVYSDWELIVVDDGSTDLTEQLVKSHTDDRIHYTHQTNQGPSVARNVGLAKSQSDYVIFLDADDWWDSRCLEQLVAALCKASSQDAVAHADWAYVSETSQTGTIMNSAVDRNLALATLVLRNPIAIHCALVRRSALLAVGGFPIEDPALEDWELWLRLASAGFGFVHVPELLAFYCWRPGSKGKDIEKRKTDRLATLERLWANPDFPKKITGIKDASYATAHIDFCVSYLSRGDTTRAMMEYGAAIRYDCELATSPDIFYRLAYAEKKLSPINHESMDNRLDCDSTAQRIENFLAYGVEVQPGMNIRSMRGTAYRALGLVCYHERQLKTSRHIWRKALFQSPLQFVWSSSSLLFAKSLLLSLLGREATSIGVA